MHKDGKTLQEQIPKHKTVGAESDEEKVFLRLATSHDAEDDRKQLETTGLSREMTTYHSKGTYHTKRDVGPELPRISQ